jgi:hypothetical protein
MAISASIANSSPTPYQIPIPHPSPNLCAYSQQGRSFSPHLPYLSEVKKHWKLRNKASSDNTFSHISHTSFSPLLPYLLEVKKHRKLRNKASSDNTFSHILRTTRRTDYLRISAHSAQRNLSGDDHFSMYVMTNQKGPCFIGVNRRVEVQTQMLVGEVIACYRVMVPVNVGVS